jgi:dimethylamine/trimethylamine dehydrogenase
VGGGVVVLVTRRTSQNGIYSELTADPDALAASGIEAVYQIGDAAGSHVIAEAIFDGHRLGEEIDQSGPARPLLYQRERPLRALKVVSVTARCS